MTEQETRHTERPAMRWLPKQPDHAIPGWMKFMGKGHPPTPHDEIGVAPDEKPDDPQGKTATINRRAALETIGKTVFALSPALLLGADGSNAPATNVQQQEGTKPEVVVPDVEALQDAGFTFLDVDGNALIPNWGRTQPEDLLKQTGTPHAAQAQGVITSRPMLRNQHLNREGLLAAGLNEVDETWVEGDAKGLYGIDGGSYLAIPTTNVRVAVRTVGTNPLVFSLGKTEDGEGLLVRVEGGNQVDAEVRRRNQTALDDTPLPKPDAQAMSTTAYIAVIPQK